MCVCARLSVCVYVCVGVGKQGVLPLSSTKLFLGLSVLRGHLQGTQRESARLTVTVCVFAVLLMVAIFFAVLRNIFVLACIIIICSLLFPVLASLDLCRKCNSNFFYAIALTFNIE